jgi:hypothetical protein
MKTELRSVFASDEKGVAVFVTLILLFVVTIAGVTILTLAGRDRIATSDMSAVRGTSEAANTALDACENQISQKSPLMTSVLNKYLKDKSYRWFFSTDSLGANKEKKVSLGNGYTYSAEIMAYDTATNVLQVRGFGYGRSSEQKSVVAQYRLSGLQTVSGSAAPQYAIYLAGSGRNFDVKIDVTGNVYIGRDFHFNFTANDCRIRGFLKTGFDPTLESSINAWNVLIDSGVYIGTRFKLNNNAFTCTSKLGIEGGLDLGFLLTVKSDGWFNGSFYGSSAGRIDMCNNTIHHSSLLSMARVDRKNEDNRGTNISDIPDKIGVGNTNDSAWGLNTTGLNAIASIPNGTVTSESLQSMYDTCSASRKINGYMVIRDQWSIGIGTSIKKFKGKVIFLLEKGMDINGNFFDMEDTARVLIIATGTATLNGFNGLTSGSSFNGLIYLRDQASIKMIGHGTYTINGAVHLAGAGCGWQMNNGTSPVVVNFKFNPSIINEFVTMGIITIPAPAGGSVPSGAAGTLRLTDFKIRADMLSVSY